MNSNANGSHVISKKNSIALLNFLLNQLTGRKLQLNNVRQRIFLWLYLKLRIQNISFQKQFILRLLFRNVRSRIFLWLYLTRIQNRSF